MTFDPDVLRRREFPWTLQEPRIYLNNAGTGPLPRRTIETLDSWNARRAQPWLVSDRDVVFPALRRTRALCAQLVGASPREIALISNTSYGLSVAAHALPIGPGDVVLMFEREFPGVVYAWTAIGKTRGFVLRCIPTCDGLADEDALLAALDAPDVRAVVLSWVGFATGYRADLTRLGQACRARGIYFVIDAIQGVGVSPLDVHESQVDILACGGQKWLLGPWGAGFLYVRESIITHLQSPIVSWLVGPYGEDYARLLDYDFTSYDDARRFEVMTLAAQDFAAMGSSIELILELGVDSIAQYVRTLIDRVIEWAHGRSDVRVVTPVEPSRRAGIVLIAPASPEATSRRLTDAGVAHSLREGAIRLSPHYYNTEPEIEAALRIFGGASGRRRARH